MDDRKAKIRKVLSRFSRQHEVQDEEDIFTVGFVNSRQAMQLVSFLEKEFQITIDDDDLDLDNFRSIARIDQLIERTIAGSAA